MPLIIALLFSLKYNACNYFYIHKYELKGIHFNNCLLLLHVLFASVALLVVFANATIGNTWVRDLFNLKNLIKSTAIKSYIK